MSGPAPVAFVLVWRKDVLADGSLLWRAKYVALALSTYMNPDGGNARPSIERLEREMNIGDRTIQRGLRDLESAGYVVRDERPGRVTTYSASCPQRVSEGHPSEELPPSQGRPLMSVVRPGVSDSHPTPVSGTPDLVQEVDHEIVTDQETLAANAAREDSLTDEVREQAAAAGLTVPAPQNKVIVCTRCGEREAVWFGPTSKDPNLCDDCANEDAVLAEVAEFIAEGVLVEVERTDEAAA